MFGVTQPSRNEERRRRAEDAREEFRLFRDKVLLAVGSIGVLGTAVAAMIMNVKEPSVALAALAVFGGLLGAPTMLRLDEKRREDQ